ncbi:MAG TPA: hypothetical protein VGG64_23435 [Pirellulales bacterium]|jgi:hypothetical protein
MVHEVDIEQIVREVLAALHGRLANGQMPPTSNVTFNGNSASKPQPTDLLELTDRLVTLATLDNRLSGIRSLVLRRGAVVTPSARDLLRAKEVQVSFAAIAPRASVALVVGIAEASGAKMFDSAAFVEALLRDGLPIERLAKTGLTSVVEELADHAARGGRPTVMLTARPEAAACLANRWSGVRAVAGRDVASIRRAIADVAANLVAVDPAGDPGGFRRVLQDYCAGWPRPVPALFDVHLPKN